jgi:large subunit ribosomal protein L24
MKIKQGDKIAVIAGKDKGKTGKVLQVFVEMNKASVEGVNIRTKHLKQRKQGEKGQKIQFPAALSLSNLMLLCPKCGKQTKVGYKILDNKKKVRTCKKCQEAF